MSEPTTVLVPVAVQARDQYNPRVQRKLANYESLFEEYGGQVTTKTVFTHDVENTVERIAIQQNTTAILLLNPTPVIEQLLVPIRGSRNLDQLLSTTAEIAAGTDTEIVCFHAVRPTESRTDGQQLLATATDRLQVAGVAAERKPSVVDRIFGDVADRIADSSAAPVLVVRKLSADAD